MAYTLNRRLAQLVDSNGQLNTGKIPNDYITSDHVADNSITSAMLHTSFTVSTSNLTAIDTDDVSEGSSNLYYTDARVGTYISGNRTFGNITTTGYIAGPATFTIDPAAVGDNTGTVVIAGNLQVDGTTTTINSTTLTVDDKLVTLASGSVNAAAADGAGIDIDISGVANPSLRYDGTNDEWSFNRNVNVNGAITAANLTIQEYTGVDAYTKINKTNTGSNLAIVSQESIYLLLDENNDQTNRSFIVGTNSGAPASATTIFRVLENGEVELKNNLFARNVGNLEVGSYNNGGTDYGLKLTPNDSSVHYHIYNDTGNLVFGASGTIGSGEKMRLASDGQLLINKTGSDVGASVNIVEADGNFRLQGGNRSIKFNNGSHEVVGLAQIASQKMQYASGRMTIDYGNSRVGIGTATYGVSPTHPLHVHMDVSNDTIDETKGLVKFQSSGGNGMIFGTLASSPYTSYIQSGYIVDTSAANYAITLNPLGGNIGIGVNDPDEKLEINGKTDYPYLKLSSTNNTSRYMRIGMANATDHVVEANGASTQLLFKTAGSTRLTISSAGYMSNTGGFQTTGPLKTGGSSNYLLLDYDGDFTGGNYYAIQDTSDNKLRISYGFSTTDCIEMDSSGNVTIPGGNLVVSGGVVSASNIKRNDQTSGSTIESSLWRSTSSYVYDATNGLRYYWIRIAQIAPSNCRGLIEYETKTDENYPGFTRGTIAYSGFNGGASFSVMHDQNTAEGVPVVVRVDTSRQIWVQFSAAWASTSRWRITNYASTLTNVDTSWTVGTNKLDPNSTSVPPNSSGNIEPGQNLRATSSSVTGTIPTYTYYRQGNVRSDEQVVDNKVVYNGAVPLYFQYKGSDTYTKTVLYDGQNDTANNVFSGLTLEMGRLTNSAGATPRTFTISDRGAGNKWCFSQYGLSFNPTSNVASAAESIDDYEEGTWSPTLGNSANINSLSLSEAGRYVKVGNLVHLEFQITGSFVNAAVESRFQFSIPFNTATSSSRATGMFAHHLTSFSNGRFNNGQVFQGTTQNSALYVYISTNQLSATGSFTGRATVTYVAA